MLRLMCIEGVVGQLVFAREKPEAAGWHNDVRILTHQADGAIAILHLDPRRKGDFKPDGAAMAAALVPDEFSVLHASVKEHWRCLVKPWFGLFQLSGQSIKQMLFAIPCPEHHAERQIVV